MNAHHTQEYILVISDKKEGLKVLSEKGQRLIVLHARIEGWVPGGALMFRSKTYSATTTATNILDIYRFWAMNYCFHILICLYI